MRSTEQFSHLNLGRCCLYAEPDVISYSCAFSGLFTSHCKSAADWVTLTDHILTHDVRMYAAAACWAVGATEHCALSLQLAHCMACADDRMFVIK